MVQESPADHLVEVEIADDANTGGRYHTMTDERITREPVNFRGKEFKTVYYGPSNPSSTAEYFPGLRDFMKSTVDSHPAIADLEQNLKGFITRQKRAKRLTCNVFVDRSDILLLLPGKEVADQHVSIYFETFEMTYRVLHQPSFMKEYANIWADLEHCDLGYVVLVLLIDAIVRCITKSSATKFVGYSSSRREAAGKIIEVCESWLGQQSQKHMTLTTLQIHCLLLAAKHISFWKRKRLWTAAGTLVRIGMSAGLHRNSDLLNKKISIFAQEMRRRLWATMIELELQASVDRGMPAVATDLHTDCGPPMNIDDRRLLEDCSERPGSEPLGNFTATSFLHASQHSLSLRASLNSLANRPPRNMDYNDVMLYDTKIKQQLTTIPTWIAGDNPSRVTQHSNGETIQELYATRDSLIAKPAHTCGKNANGDGSRSIDRGSGPLIVTSLLELQLLQFILLLHTPFARRAVQLSRYQGSVIACYEAANRIIELYSKLQSAESYLLGLLRHDVTRAAFSICHNVHMSCSLKGKSSLHRSQPL